MAEYLPLDTQTQRFLPAPCQGCAWWQTSGIGRVSPRSASTVRTRWMTSVETDWGPAGIIQLLETPGRDAAHGPAGAARAHGACAGDAPLSGPSLDGPSVAAIHFAPAASLPRVRDLLFAELPARSALLFCLRSEDPAARRLQRTLLHHALHHLKQRRVREAYAFASVKPAGHPQERCEFFSRDLLAANGFHEVLCSDDIFLMRADLRGLLSVLGPLETLVRRLLHQEPAPSPAAWTSRGP